MKSHIKGVLALFARLNCWSNEYWPSSNLPRNIYETLLFGLLLYQVFKNSLNMWGRSRGLDAKTSMPYSKMSQSVGVFNSFLSVKK